MKPNKSILTFRDINPILNIEEDILINRRGDYSVVFKVELPPVFSLWHDDYSAINNAMSAAINIMSEGVAIQRMDFYTPTSPKLSLDNKSYSAYRDIKMLNAKRVIKSETYFIFTKLAVPNERRTFANSLFDLLSQFRVNGLFKEKHYKHEVVQNFLAEINGFVSAVEGCLDKSRRMRFERLGEQEIEELVFGKYFSLDFSEHQINIAQDFAELRDRATVGNNIINIFSMDSDGLPPALYSSIIEGNFRKEGIAELPVSFLHDLAFDLDFPHIINQVIYTIPQKKTFEAIGKKKNMMKATSVGNAQNARNAAFIENFLNVYEGRGAEKLIKFHFGIMLISSKYNDEEHRKNYNEIKNILGGKQIKFTVNTYNTLRYFFTYAPGCGGDIAEEDRALCLSTHAPCFGVYEGNMKSATNGLLLIDRVTGWPLQVDLIKNPLITNQNRLVVGPSGTGKSYLMNHITKTSLDQKNDVVVVDVGYSYKRLCEYYKGIFIECSAEKPLCFNPFLIVPKGENGKYPETLEDDQIEFITNLIYTAWQSANNDSKITSEVNTVLTKMVLGYYRHLNENSNEMPNFTNFYHYSKDQLTTNNKYKNLSDKIFNTDSFLLVMSLFVEEGRGEEQGRYYYLFNAIENPNIFGTNFVVFELEKIKSNKVLFPIMYYILSHVVLDKLLVQNKKTGKRLEFVLDEAWMLFSGDYGDVTDFISYAYRTFRKHGGAITMATQDIEDIFRNEKVGEAIKENCDLKILKLQKLDKLSKISQSLGLSDQNKALLFSMDQPHKDVYMQFKDTGFVYRLEADAFNTALYTSDPDHKRAINEDLEKTNSLETTLINMVDSGIIK